MPESRAVVISDVHIGTGAPTVWYQREVHDGYLSAILRWVLANVDSVREVVLLGDMFDLWTYPPDVRPPTLRQIIEANPAILGPGGLLSQVVTAMNGAVTLMLGNHDANLTDADVRDLRDAVGPLALGPDTYTLTGSSGRRTTFSHGHLWTMFNAPDPKSPWNKLPVGHFVTRTFAHQMQQTLAPGQTVADLPNMGAPNGFSLADFLGHVKFGDPDVSVARMLLEYCAGIAQLGDTVPILLSDGSTVTLGDAKRVYDDLFSRWMATEGGLLGAIRAARADQDGENLGWYAQRLALRTGSDLVLFGHTHTAIGGFACSPVNYVNSGFECASTPDMPAKEPTFVVVDLDFATAEVFQVGRTGNDYTINSFDAPLLGIVPSPGMDFSSYVSIENRTAQPLTWRSSSNDRGVWVVDPPGRIEPGTTARLWLQDDLGALGSDGAVSYAGPGGNLDLSFTCPSGVLPNWVSCSSGNYTTRTANGDWENGACAPTGHPLQVRVTVPAGGLGPDIPFHTGDDGQTSGPANPAPPRDAGNPSAPGYADDAPLRAGQRVAVNGSSDLSRVIVGNSQACISTVQLAHVAGLTYRVDVYGQGPSGLGSGSLYLWFTDQSGDRYQLQVWRSARDWHEVTYTSSAPGIVKIEWSP